ncbi:Cardiolipin synthetase [hydrothermal vent metagenome]|uniref:Cardiolipin synthetase n=1 Tax=hydrothermal vent metagenome TaxID=652676 RepID=A0A3B1E2P8_9ZZZZ
MKRIILFSIISVSVLGCNTASKQDLKTQMGLSKDEYIDLKDKKIVEANRGFSKGVQKNKLRNGLRIVDYLIMDSHMIGLMTKPISSLSQLAAITRDTTYDVLTPNFLNFIRIQKEMIPALAEGAGMDLVQWEKTLDKMTGQKSSLGEIDFLIDGEKFFDRFIEEIESAQKSIKLRTFIFDNDDYAVKIADLLKEKSKDKNIKIKILLEGAGVIMGEGDVPEDSPKDFIPPESMPKYLKKNSNIKVRVRANAWFKMDHVKTTIIDNKVCFLGGMNIGKEYRYEWHDLMMEVRGPIVNKIMRDFYSAWAHSSLFGDLAYLANKLTKWKRLKEDEGYPIRLLYTRFNDFQIYRTQLAAIRNTKKYIYISNAYFSDNNILYELIRARRRGVDVRVILPVKGNHEIMNASNVVTANILFKNGIRVFFYPGMSHVKAAIYDGWLCTGSANFDKLSLKNNLELNLATSHRETVEILKKDLFEKDFAKSVEMNGLFESGFKNRIAEFLADHL